MIFGQEDEHVVTDAQLVWMLGVCDSIAMSGHRGPLGLQEQKDLLKTIDVDPEAFFERVEKERKGT
jgi:hypothetical protein